MTLVPSNHTPRDHALSAALAPLGAISPAVIETVWDAWRCPAALLPFLGWALSVDFWDEDADENTLRQAIADSPAYHRRKGTDGAVGAAVAALGRPASVVDWHATVPEGRRGTFQVLIPLADHEEEAELTALLVKARRLISMAKPKSRAFSVALTREVHTPLIPSVGIYSIESIELGAPPDTITVQLTPRVGIGSHETTFIGGAFT